jgi:hypothetical protein
VGRVRRHIRFASVWANEADQPEITKPGFKVIVDENIRLERIIKDVDICGRISFLLALIPYVRQPDRNCVDSKVLVRHLDTTDMRFCWNTWERDLQCQFCGVNSVQISDMPAHSRFDTTSFVSCLHGYDIGVTYRRYNTTVLS